jgi:hypothetical protein
MPNHPEQVGNPRYATSGDAPIPTARSCTRAASTHGKTLASTPTAMILGCPECSAAVARDSNGPGDQSPGPSQWRYG